MKETARNPPATAAQAGMNKSWIAFALRSTMSPSPPSGATMGTPAQGHNPTGSAASHARPRVRSGPSRDL